MSAGDEMRPDGRITTPGTRQLRVATRALRHHLDELPIDYGLVVSGDRFLAGLAFMFARQRYDCAESMIGAGFGSTVLGSIARSLFVDGLRWLWIGDQPERGRCLLGDRLEERNHICILLEETDASCPILPRWFMPLPDVADLTGQSLAWLDAPPMPGEDELLDDFLAGSGTDLSMSKAGNDHTVVLRRARTLLEMGGLRGAVRVLAHALVAYASRSSRVVTGDVLASGTCGNGGCLAELWGRDLDQAPPPLQPGDVVALAVEGIGQLTNTVIHGRPATRSRAALYRERHRLRRSIRSSERGLKWSMPVLAGPR